MADHKTAQELADECKRLALKLGDVRQDDGTGTTREADAVSTLHAAIDHLAALASQAEPTMSDAIAAGDGTLHGAIDYWQQRASEDGRRIDAWASNPMWRLNRWAGKWSISTPDSALTDWLGSPREAIDAAIAAKGHS